MNLVTHKVKIHSNLAQIINFLPKGRNRLRQFCRKGAIAWDPWILKDDDYYRIYYLSNPKVSKVDVHGSWWNEASIYGAISTDLKNWKNLGLILEPDPENFWESQRILAGCTYKENNTYYLFYSAAGIQDSLDEVIGLATSTDGLHWRRCSSNPLFSNLHDRNRWYGKYEGEFGNGKLVEHRHWRDPYIVKDHGTGKYYMFICAASQQRGPSPFRGCVGLAVADKIAGPYELLPPACAPVVKDSNESVFVEMERPQVIHKGGKYHLFFSCWPHRLNSKWLQQVGQERITASSLYWYTADNITGPFIPTSDKPIVIGSEKTEMYGTNFFPAPQKLKEEFIASGWFNWSFTLGVSPSFRVMWNDSSIRIYRRFDTTSNYY